MIELREGSCFPSLLVGVNVGLALVDGFIAVLSFVQLIRMRSRNIQHGWTRQKVFHLMIGSSNLGYFLYFLLSPIAACERWQCWSHSCGFIFMAFPNVLFFAVFLLLLSFWVDLCHQSDDEDEEDEESNVEESLLEKTFNERSSLSTDYHRRCLPLRLVHVQSRQRIVILVTLLVILIMLACAVIIWIGMGENPIDSTVVARVYVDIFAAAMLLLAGALACYGLILCLKMSKVRTERASFEHWKVAGLAVVCVLCFTSSAFVALLTNIPMLYHWHQQEVNGLCVSLLVLYYFVGSSIPSAFLLWVMREIPPSVTANIQQESATLRDGDDEMKEAADHILNRQLEFNRKVANAVVLTFDNSGM
ncbi:Major facilitator superfamily domain containing protein [Parasponia andersonii]|uniref:Major facilitator superfamily domain containing protein n=1 Tax=Parasponia andersonii TaxID=3476 RepID=A0A2P5ATZ1_PARAD|nr:Major facilitator superfamily domain containing protein [Parasponia andersonii]